MDGNSLQNTMTSTLHVQPGATKKRNKELIVDQKHKIARELEISQRLYHNRPSPSVVITKWISTVLLGVLLLGCLILSKVSVIALSFKMNSKNMSVQFPRTDGVISNAEVTYTSQLFVMLLVILLVPNVISLIRGLFTGFYRNDIPWPTKKGFILGFAVSLFESIGTCLFVFKAPDLIKNNPYILVLLMQSVFLVPVFTYVGDGIRNNSSNKKTVGLFLVAAIFELAGVGGTFYLLLKEDDLKVSMIYPVAAILCLSIAWSPVVQRNLLKTPKKYVEPTENSYADDPDQTYVMGTASHTYSGSAGLPSTSSQTSEMTESYRLRNIAQQEPEDRREEIKEEPPTWKLTIYMSVLKIGFTIATSLIIYCHALFNADRGMSDFKRGWYDWENINRSGNSYELYYFIANMAAGAVGYIVGYIACTTCMQRWAFSLPLILATPICLILMTAIDQCNELYIPFVITGVTQYPGGVCSVPSSDLLIFIASATCLCLAQICCYGWVLFKSQFLVLLSEVQLFWTPMFNTVLLEQWLMLVRKNKVNDDDYVDPTEKIKSSKIVICTTMYREADYEMRQLLESIMGINRAHSPSAGQRSFEAHVFFDGAVKDKKPQEFVLQLVSLAESTLNVKAEMCTKNSTPYGMTLSWRLDKNMLFVVHLKDNLKVKNKKRWSQVMYMSYVMDYLMNISDNVSEMDTYILTTDADVKFTADSVEALLDLMSRDHSVGAVCSRTHPLGSGPLVWYQIFEYAIGHWFQKAAEHVVGSVLCSPGCFSVYRCKALRDILPRYASNVEHAFDFLTMDMGEDRWLCTLMVQSGWRIEYCAAAENSTHCPEDFDEFYKQRRRWVASTLANIMLLLKEWSIVSKFNHRVTFIFLIYQAILLFATLIGPSSVMLVVSGGLVYGWGINPVASLIIQIVVTIALVLACLFCSSKTQLNACKLVSLLYAVVMTAVVVGTAVQIIQAPVISDTIPVSTTTLYLAGMAGIFLVTGLLHLKEFVYLLHGIWFLLCLPSGYLVLIIYSVCNITDRSWGTREVKVKSVVSRGRTWQENLEHYIKQIFFCCFKRVISTAEVAVQTDQQRRRTTSSTDQTDQSLYSMDPNRSMANGLQSMGPRTMNLSLIEEAPGSFISPGMNYDTDEDDDVDMDEDPKAVGVWLPAELKGLAKDFENAGFENTMLISGMTEKELKDIGIKKKGVRRRLLENIKELPDFEIQANVPENVEKWLKIIGLSRYTKTFHKEQIQTSKSMELLKSFGRSELEKELKITKQGHIKRLLYAIGKLRNPTIRERKLIEVRKSLEGVHENKLSQVSPEENEFWETLRSKCLLPQSSVFGSEDELKSKLGELRNGWLTYFAVSNTLWLILIETLASKGELLEAYGSNPVGLTVLVLFSLVIVIQFLAMIVHRIGTLTHFLARAPYRFGETFNTSWAFNESDITSMDDIEARAEERKAKMQSHQRLKDPKWIKTSRKRGERESLIHPGYQTIIEDENVS